MTDLIVYYSRTNKTKTVAKTIADIKDAKLLEIVDKKNRDGPVQYVLGALQMLFNRSTNISYDRVNLKEFDTIYIGTPVWTSGPSPAICEFIEENDFTNKNVVTFATFLSNNGKKTTDKLNKLLEDKNAIVKDSFWLCSRNTDLVELTKEKISN